MSGGWRRWGTPPAPRLAAGERLLWRGGPSARGVALRVFHVRLVAGYFVFLTLADMAQARLMHLGGAAALRAAVPSLLTGAGTLLILALLAGAVARTTRYALTSERIVMQFGVALPARLTLPLHRIAGLSVRLRGDGTGDIALRLHPGEQVMYPKLWPHARPWKLAAAEPMLRDVPDAGLLAAPLCRALAMDATAWAASAAARAPLPLAS